MTKFVDLYFSKLIPWKKGHLQQFIKVFLSQTYFTFVQALPLLAIIGTLTGVAFAFQAQLGLTFFGGRENLGKFLVFILLREAVPFLTGMLLITRSVTAVASELATMKVQKEIDALETIGIDIEKYLLHPRIAAGSVSFFCMAVTIAGFALLGCWIGSNWYSYYPLNEMLDNIALTLTPADFIFFILKTFPNGLLVFYIGARKGLSLKKASFEVPIVTNQAVVESLLAALGFQLILSALFYAIIGVKL